MLKLEKLHLSHAKTFKKVYLSNDTIWKKNFTFLMLKLEKVSLSDATIWKDFTFLTPKLEKTSPFRCWNLKKFPFLMLKLEKVYLSDAKTWKKTSLFRCWNQKKFLFLMLKLEKLYLPCAFKNSRCFSSCFSKLEKVYLSDAKTLSTGAPNVRRLAVVDRRRTFRLLSLPICAGRFLLDRFVRFAARGNK